MNTATVNSPVFNDCWNVIKDWSNDMKLALISKLSSSMIMPRKKSKEKTLEDFFGIMKDEPYFPTAEELHEIVKDDGGEDIEKFVI